MRRDLFFLFVCLNILQNSLKGISQSTANKEATINNYIRLADAFEKEKRYDSAAKYLLRSSYLLNQTGDFHKAQEVHASIVRIGQESGVDSLVLQGYSLLAAFYTVLTDNEKAKESALKGLEAYKKNPNVAPAKYGLLLQRLGNAYRGVGDYAHAIPYYKQAQQVYEEKMTGQSEMSYGIANDIGVCYYWWGDLEEASSYFSKAVSIAYRLFGESDMRTARAVMNLGNIFLDRCEYEKALTNYNKSLLIHKKLLGEYHIDQAKIYTNLANTYSQTGDFEKAREYIGIAHAITLKTIGKLSQQTAHSFYKKGLIYQDAGEYDTAILHYKEAIKICDQLSDRTFPWYGSIQGLGDCYTQTGNYSLAEAAQNKAYNFFVKTKREESYDMISLHYEIGERLFREKKYAGALNHFEQSIRGFMGDAKTISYQTDISEIEDPVSLLRSLHAKARTLVDYSKEKPELSAQAFSTFANADILIDLMHNPILADQYRESILQLARDIHIDYVALCYEAYTRTTDDQYLKTAFKMAEKSRAVILRENLRRIETNNMAGIPDYIKERETYLRKTLRLYRSQVADEAISEVTKVVYRDSILVLTKAYEAFRDSLKRKYTEYYQLKYNNDVIDLATVQQHLSTETALVSYLPADEALYAFVITKGMVSFFKTNLTSNLDSLIAIIRSDISTQSPVQNSLSLYSYFTTASYQLYSQLFDFISPAIPESITRLVVIPGGPLAYIPFGILVTKAPGTGDNNYARLPYLLTKYIISYAYSATQWTSPISHHIGGKKSFAGFAPKYPTDIWNSSELASYAGFRDRMTELKFTGTEVKDAANYFSGTVYLDDKASEENFKKIANDYRILHLAMHALVNEKNPLESKLLFTPGKDSADNGFLNAWELYNMTISADLAVLSACNTGYGKLTKGEGVMSLSRAFSYSGCNSLVMSLWEANDQATSQIMRLFYKHLAAGAGKDEALRNAKLEYLQTADPLLSHPYFWGAFIANGDMSPIDKGGNSFLKWPIIGGLLLLAAAGVYWWRLRR